MVVWCMHVCSSTSRERSRSHKDSYLSALRFAKTPSLDKFLFSPSWIWFYLFLFFSPPSILEFSASKKDKIRRPSTRCVRPSFGVPSSIHLKPSFTEKSTGSAVRAACWFCQSGNVIRWRAYVSSKQNVRRSHAQGLDAARSRWRRHLGSNARTLTHQSDRSKRILSGGRFRIFKIGILNYKYMVQCKT